MVKNILLRRVRQPDVREYRCERCKSVLVNPVEKTSLYVWDGGFPVLICPDCATDTDTYIWGNSDNLDWQDWSIVEKTEYLERLEVLREQVETDKELRKE
ncbi:hypothetical protein ES707_07554 [subsurface metagenome]